MGLKDYYSHLGAFPRVKAPFLYFFSFFFMLIHNIVSWTSDIVTVSLVLPYE